jgi:hypothetical protein
MQAEMKIARNIDTRANEASLHFFMVAEMTYLSQCIRAPESHAARHII